MGDWDMLESLLYPREDLADPGDLDDVVLTCLSYFPADDHNVANSMHLNGGSCVRAIATGIVTTVQESTLDAETVLTRDAEFSKTHISATTLRSCLGHVMRNKLSSLLAPLKSATSCITLDVCISFMAGLAIGYFCGEKPPRKAAHDAQIRYLASEACRLQALSGWEQQHQYYDHFVRRVLLRTAHQ